MERTSVNAHGPNKLNTSCYQLYYMLGPTLNTEKIHKSRLNRGWSGMCYVKTIHLVRFYPGYACQLHSGHTHADMYCTYNMITNWEEKKQGRKNRQVCGHVYGFGKDCGISWKSMPSVCFVFCPTFSLFNTHLSHRVANIVEAVFDLLCCQPVCRVSQEQVIKKSKLQQENI